MTIDLYLNQSATLKKTASRDVYGKQILNVGTSIRCRFQGSHSRIMTEAGEELTADAELWVLGSADVEHNDIIEYESQTYRIVKVETKRNLTGGANHKKALLIKTS